MGTLVFGRNYKTTLRLPVKKRAGSRTDKAHQFTLGNLMARKVPAGLKKTQLCSNKLSRSFDLVKSETA